MLNMLIAIGWLIILAIAAICAGVALTGGL